MKQLKVEEKVILEITETETATCVGCFFENKDICLIWRKYLCESEQRSDHKNVKKCNI